MISARKSGADGPEDNTALQLIDKLIACWNLWDTNERYYLTVLAPSIVRSDGCKDLMQNEKQIVAELRRLLSEAEWNQLPELIAQRRANNLNEIASDRERAEARRERERREQEKRARRKEEERRERERRQAEEALIARKKALLARIEAAFGSDFLSADAEFADDPDAELITSSVYAELKTRFVRDWTARELGLDLDSEQACAVSGGEGAIQVVARAGSGKTRTLVTRTMFLQKHCQVSPRALLLLAFNKKAADEMKDRLAQALGPSLPHVMTFHALAYALVHPEEDLVFDDGSTDQLRLSREVQEVIDEHVRSGRYAKRIRALMLAHFREDWERIVDGRFHLTMDEFLAHRHALPRESLKGDYVKSFGEKVIANLLFEHGIEYRYERNFRWSGVNYRPDFTIQLTRNSGVIIEYFGLQDHADYDEMAQEKREFWARQSAWTLLEFSPRDIAENGVDAFAEILLKKLKNAGVHYHRRSEEETWQIVRRRAIDGFTGAMKTFVSRCRKRNLTPQELAGMVTAHKACSTAEALFLEIGVSIYKSYLQRLSASSKEDFDGLMWRSASLIRQGITRFARARGTEQGNVADLRFVMIDEFQDFSAMFFELIDAIRSINPSVQFFCVGDDWQAINGFAGSELRFFRNFARYFRDTTRCYIRTNYRPRESVVAVGNAVMNGRGPEAESKRAEGGHVCLCRMEEFTPTAAEEARHGGDEITPAVLRLVRDLLDQGLDVVLLSRRNGVPWYVNFNTDAGIALNPLSRFLEHVRSLVRQLQH